jgi:hypothetical protein
MNLYVVVVYLISAVNGELQQELVSSKPMTAEACMEALSDRGPVPVRDGLAQFAVCKKVEGGKVST